jgi:coproporphyrinogen III oxidase
MRTDKEKEDSAIQTSTTPFDRSRMENMILAKQNEICDWLEKVDGTKMITDKYDRSKDGGYGITRVLAGGRVFEKAGCNISVVKGVLPPAAVKQMASR